MCLIIDNDVIHRVFDDCDDVSYKDIHKALFVTKKTTIKVVYGGRLTSEYFLSQSIKRLLIQLDRAGRAMVIDDYQIALHEKEIAQLGLMQSNDVHVVALARASKVRLLCSNDQKLQKDFTNPKILKPKGKVYKSPSHGHLLNKCCG